MSSAPNAFFRSHACEFYAEALSTRQPLMRLALIDFSGAGVSSESRYARHVRSFLLSIAPNDNVVKHPNLNLDVGSHAQVQTRSQVRFVSFQEHAWICQKEWQFRIVLVEKETCCSEGWQVCFVSCQEYACICQMGVVILNCLLVNMNVWSRGRGNFVF